MNPQAKQMSVMERCDCPGSRSSAAQWPSRLRQTYFQTEPAASAAKARCTLRTDVLQACAIDSTERPGSVRQDSIWRLSCAHWMSWGPSAGGASSCSRRASHVIAVRTFCKHLPLRPPRRFICLKASSSVDRRNSRHSRFGIKSAGHSSLEQGKHVGIGRPLENQNLVFARIAQA